jgi:hypothetical protein
MELGLHLWFLMGSSSIGPVISYFGPLWLNALLGFNVTINALECSSDFSEQIVKPNLYVFMHFIQSICSKYSRTCFRNTG